jgi:hypothetical protein
LGLVLGGLIGSAHAQGTQTGTLRGVVLDQQGLPIPSVTVSITSPQLQGQRTTLSELDGGFVFRQLPAGTYQVTYESSAFTPARQTTVIPLGGTVEQTVTLRAAGVAEEVQVVAETPAPIATPTIGLNIRQEEIESLPVSRTLQGIATLSPALTTNTPNAGQVTINGAFAFDNVFMLNGVDVNDNLFGSPQNLFIEDAIAETQVLTSGISAEYGRFTGGVVNAITKSGGNTFDGSYRLNLSNPTWSTKTPFEVERNTQKTDTLAKVHEGTFGGPILMDRIWFFGAGRLSESSNSQSLPQTGLAYTQVDTNRRGELKITGTALNNHTIQGGYLNNYREQTERPTFSFSIDQASIGDRTLPNWYGFVNYRGVLRNNLLAEAQFSQRKFQFKNSGGTLTGIVESPFITLTQQLGHYNARYFDSTDPESRNNRQFTGSVTSFLEGSGRHEVKAGYEFFRSQRTGGNSQSATGYVFDADYATDAAGNPLYDGSGRLIPVFVPGETLIENWLPVRGATLNVDNQSLFVQDHWTINRNVSADLGFRYERVRSEATGGLVGVDTDTWVPRLALAYDPYGNGRFVINTSYGHYAGRYSESQIGENSNVGTPDLLLGVYTGPAGQGRNFGPGFTPANYQTVLGQFPTANVFIEEGLSSPIVQEFTLSAGGTITNRGYGEVSYIWRDTDNFIEDFIEIGNGTTTVIRNGQNFGTFTNIVYRNTDIADRKYQGLVFQGRYNILNNWRLNGYWTVQLKNEGNYEGEFTNQPGSPSAIGDYPELRDPALHYPYGRNSGPSAFQRHRVALWSVYDQGLGRFGSLTVSGVMRAESGEAYSLRATGQPFTAAQRAAIAAYPDAPSSQTLFFGGRGTETFKGYGAFDTSVNYNIPVWRDVRPWIKLDVFNLFNNLKQIESNIAVTRETNGPTNALGVWTTARRGASFGNATANSNFIGSQAGWDGEILYGRTIRVSMGVRF